MKKNIIILLIVAVVAVAVFIIIRKRRSGIGGNNNSQASAPQSNNNNNQAPVIANETFPLKYGSKGKNVELLQIALNKRFGESLQVDGSFKDLTEDALMKNTGKKQVNKSLELTNLALYGKLSIL